MLFKQENADLKPLNTLALPAQASWLIKTSGEEALVEALHFARQKQLPVFPFGGGSNLVLGRDLDAVVLQQLPEPLDWSNAQGQEVLLRVPAGYHWHQLVLETTSRGLFGLENLALIPGRAGAAPIQNLGAYGAQISDCLIAVEGYWLDASEPERCLLDARELDLGYRSSRFQHDWKGRFIITALQLKLSKQTEPCLAYSDLAARVEGKQALRREQQAACVPLPRIIAETVAEIRQEKLPDPARLPNVGSFFKNPVVSQKKASELEQHWPQLPTYPDPGGVKLAAGWLVEQCGFKGFKEADFGVHEHQALVLVHFGQGQAPALLNLAEKIKQAVQERFEVILEEEPLLLLPSAKADKPGQDV